MTEKLRPLSEKRLEQIERTWESTSDPDLFELEFANVFSMIRNELTTGKEDDEHFEVVDDRGQAQALLEIIDSASGSQSKLLRYYFSPQQLVRSLDSTDVEFGYQASKIFTEAVFAVIEQSLRRGCRDVKIYARHDEMMQVLTMLKYAIDPPPEELGRANIEAVFEGRWLRILFPMPSGN